MKRPGSPPLAREQQYFVTSFPSNMRITPARAGTTNALLDRRDGSGDHPRSRGNNFAELIAALFASGSPPLAREQLAQSTQPTATDGITPARAGTTYKSVSCGINTYGSPPLAREQLTLWNIWKSYRRITPARAGTTHYESDCKGVPQDHPRSRGNNRKKIQ